MSDLEKKLLKDVLHLVVDEELKVLVDALVAKLPASAQGIAVGLEPMLLAQLIPFLDAKVDAI